MPTVAVLTIEAISDATEGGADGLFRVTRTGDPTDPLYFLVTVTCGTATPDSDYTYDGNSPVVSPLYSYFQFPGGASTVDIPITPVDDGAYEGNETVTLGLLEYVNCTPGDPSSATLSIIDNDVPGPAQFIVTTASDVIDENDGVVSLREAIEVANLPFGNGVRTITFDMNQVGPDIYLQTPLPTLQQNISILGPGGLLHPDLRITRGLGADDFRLFTVAANTTVVISGVTLAGGVASGADDGGAIYSEGNLTVSSCELTGNSANRGGAIAVVYDSLMSVTPPTLTIEHSLIQGNGAFNGGGVLVDGADLVMFNCVVSLNVADSSGGGILMRGQSDDLEDRINVMLDGVEIMYNIAQTDGGGISADNCYLFLTGQTDIHHNQATDAESLGGGVYAVNSAVIADHVRIDFNDATWGDGMYLAIDSSRTDGEFPIEYYGGDKEAKYV